MMTGFCGISTRKKTGCDAGLGVELIEPDALSLGGGRHQRDGTANQGQAQKPVPTCSRHVVLLKRTSTKPHDRCYGNDQDQPPIRCRTAAVIDCRVVLISAQGSDASPARRSGTVSTVKPPGRTLFSTSSQDSGVETGAPGRARGL